MVSHESSQKQTEGGFQRVVDEPKSLCARYDKIFLLVYGLQSCNSGLKLMYALAKQDLFKNYLMLLPSEAQFWTTFILLPCRFKFFYDVFADQCPIFGSRKKSYMIIMGLI